MKVPYINLVNFDTPRIPEIGDEDFAVFDEAYDNDEEDFEGDKDFEEDFDDNSDNDNDFDNAA